MDTEGTLFYPAFDGLLAGSVELEAEAVPRQARPVHATLRTGAAGSPVGPLLYRWTDGSGDAVVETRQTPGGQRLTLTPHTLLEIEGDEMRIDAPSAERLSALQTHHVLDQALPRLLGQRSRLVVHAAAFASTAGAVLVIGDGGAGKSTLAAAAACAGLALIADDCVLLEPHAEGIDCVGNHAYLRCDAQTLRLLPALEDITDDALEVEDKLRLRLAGCARIAQGERRPLAALVVLEQGASALTPTRPAPAELLARLGGQLFVLDPTDRALMGCLLQQLADIVARVPAWRLSCAHDRDRPETLLAAVIEALSSA